MARLTPLPANRRSLSSRFIIWLMRRMMGRELEPYAIAAHASRVPVGFMALNAVFETGQWALPVELRKLVHLRVAQVIGCVF